MNRTDSSTQDLTTCRLKLSDDLEYAVQEHAGATYYHIEARAKGRFFRVGYSEYVFLSLLDGNTTVAQALALSTRALGARALSQKKAMEVTLWLLDNGLARLTGNPGIFPNSDHQSSYTLRSLNPFWLKIPLLHPDRLLDWLFPLIGWLFSPWMTLLGLAVIAAGLVVIATNWAGFVASSHLIFAPHNWLSMAIAWMMLKVVHELGHGLACKRYGGEVREAGLIFILLAPAAFVDVTSAWRFSSKWQRIHVAAAGMFVELVLAAVAAVFWSQTESVVLRHLLFNVIVMASLSTLVFNANPLMRFDGYYILADLLEIPNLASEGLRFVQQLGMRVFLGRNSTTREPRGLRGWMVRSYGLAVCVWRLVVCVSLVAAASVLFKGAGLVLGVIGAASWFGKPILECARYLYRQFDENRPVLLRAGIVAAIITGIAYATLVWLPWPATITAPVVVEYTDLSIVRSHTDGFVEHIHVHDGQHVQAGDLLVELRNDPLVTELRELRATVLQADALHRAALNKHDAVGAQVALRNRQADVQRLAEVQEQLDGLKVYAPVTGRIVARELNNTIGTYVKEGAELLAVGDERRKELLVSVAQQEIDDAMPLIGRTVRFRTGDLHGYEGTLTSLEPRASRHLPHPALSATVGGALPVAQPDADDGRGDLRLVQPRFPGVIALTNDTSSLLAAGDRGYAVLGFSRESIGQHIWGRFSHWLDQLAKLRQE